MLLPSQCWCWPPTAMPAPHGAAAPVNTKTISVYTMKPSKCLHPWSWQSPNAARNINKTGGFTEFSNYVFLTKLQLPNLWRPGFSRHYCQLPVEKLTRTPFLRKLHTNHDNLSIEIDQWLFLEVVFFFFLNFFNQQETKSGERLILWNQCLNQNKIVQQCPSMCSHFFYALLCISLQPTQPLKHVKVLKRHISALSKKNQKRITFKMKDIMSFLGLSFSHPL